MSPSEPSRKKDLPERTFKFAQDVRFFVRKLPRTISNIEDVKQLIRSSGSVGANYIEAEEAVGKKDFLLKLKISRKESKESRFWLRLLNLGTRKDLKDEQDRLISEATQFLLIFSAMINNFKNKAEN